MQNVCPCPFLLNWKKLSLLHTKTIFGVINILSMATHAKRLDNLAMKAHHKQKWSTLECDVSQGCSLLLVSNNFNVIFPIKPNIPPFSHEVVIRQKMVVSNTLRITILMEWFLQCSMNLIINDELNLHHPLHLIVLLGMYNYISYCYMKTSLLSLSNCANCMYMVCGMSFFSFWKIYLFFI